jgi:hypothetical protein
MSQLFEFTVKTKGFAAPASTVIVSPLWEAPKAKKQHQPRATTSRKIGTESNLPEPKTKRLPQPKACP